MNGKVFIDTNIIVYSFESQSESRKVSKAREVLQDLLVSGRGVISTQVLQEFYVTATRKIAVPLNRREAEEAIESLCQMLVVQTDIEIIRDAIEIEHNEEISFWDAMIVAAALRADCSRILSEDLNPDQSYAGIRIENPLME